MSDHERINFTNEIDRKKLYEDSDRILALVYPEERLGFRIRYAISRSFSGIRPIVLSVLLCTGVLISKAGSDNFTFDATQRDENINSNLLYLDYLKQIPDIRGGPCIDERSDDVHRFATVLMSTPTPLPSPTIPPTIGVSIIHQVK